VLLVMAHKAEHFRHLGERLAPPLMTLTSDGQLQKAGLIKGDLEALGFRLLVDAMTPVLLFHQTMKQCYQAIANGHSAGLLAPQGSGHAQNELHRTIGLDAMLAVERETVEK